jgi:predicted regulator of Ras-like GTPase activity (Roadblock/LC7/MglB family)
MPVGMLNSFKSKLNPTVTDGGGSAPPRETGASDSTADESVTLPLERIIKALPDSLKAFISKIPPADTKIAFAVGRIMPQVSKGAIRITLDELSAASPPGTFQSTGSQGATEINLPLKDVLPQLGAIMRRKSSGAGPAPPQQNLFAAAAPVSQPPQSKPAPTPAPPAFAATFAPAPVTSPVFAPAPSSPPPAEPTPGQVSLSLSKLLAGLSPECRALLQTSPADDAMIELPSERLAPQLAKGRISITMTELAAAAPKGAFANLGQHAETPVNIPLGDVLRQIGPGALKRKKPVKVLEGLDKTDFFGASASQQPAVDPRPAGQDTTFAPRPVAPVIEAPPAFQPAFQPSFQPAPTPAETPAFQPLAKPAPAPPPQAAPLPEAPDGHAAFPLANLLKTLPPELQALLATAPDPDAVVNLPIERLAPQLAKGRVTITLAELADAAPAGLFSNLAGRENELVNLPLGDVLSRIGPAALKRKKPVKTLEGLDKTDFFGAGSSAAEPAPQEPPATEGGTTFVPKTQLEPEGFPAVTAPPTFQPAPATPRPPAAAPAFVPAESPAAEPFSPPPQSTGGPPADTVSIALTKLADRWPALAKAELARLPADTAIVFPAAELGNALKTGRIHFTWAQLRSWSRPRTSLSSNALEHGTLDIPLRVVVGPFMAAMRGKPEPDTAEETPSSAPPSEQAKPTYTAPIHATAAPAPAPTLAPGMAGISMTSRPVDTGSVFIPPLSNSASGGKADGSIGMGDLLGMPGKNNWTPVEIVQRVAGLPAVSGAMISLAEGQVAASDLPTALDPATIANRIPKLHSAAGDEIREMGLEPLSFLSFSTAGTPWLVFKLGNIFFTVQGRPGEHLPVSRLESIAVQIGNQRR